MLKLTPKPTFSFTAEFAVPGESDTQRVVLIGRHQGQQALAAWAEKAGTLAGAELVGHVVDVLQGWEGVAGEDGTSVPFSPDTCRALLDAYPGSPSVVALAYIQELSAARRKN